jgi:predicted nucleotidyltransferase
LIELDEEASMLGVGGFQYETQMLLGIEVDVIPTFVLSMIEDQEFAQTIQSEAISL